MVTDIEKRLHSLGIDVNTEIGYKLKRLDDAYNKLDYHKKSIEQIKEDIEIMEIFIMHYINRKFREKK